MSRRRLLILLNQIPDKTFLFFYMFKLSASVCMYRKFSYTGRSDQDRLQEGREIIAIVLVGDAGVAQTQPILLTSVIGNVEAIV